MRRLNFKTVLLVASSFLALTLQGFMVVGAVGFAFAALVSALLALAIRRTERIKGKLDAIILFASVILALCTAVGLRFTVLLDEKLGVLQIAELAIILLGNTSLMYIALNCLDEALSRIREGSHQCTKSDALIASCAIMCCWIPFLIAFFPGSVPYDGYYQLDMYFDVLGFTDHHPVATTLLIGWTVFVGQALFGDINFGVFLFVALQSILASAMYGYVCYTAGRISKRRSVFWCSVCFFGVIPIWGTWAQTLGKDTLYYAFMALFVAQTALFVLRDYKQLPSWKGWLIWVAAGLGIVLFRKEGIAIVVATGLVLLMAIQAMRMRFAAALTCFAVAFGVTTFVITPAVVDQEDWQRYDAYSVVLQQVARTVQKHGKEIPDEDKKAIDNLLGIDTLAKRYVPYDADPVKDQARKADAQQLRDFFKVWAKLGVKYPATYLAAFFNLNYAYYYPPYAYEEFGVGKFYIMEGALATGDLPIAYLESEILQDARKLTQEAVDNLSLAPIFGLLFAPGTYTWISIICACFISRNGRKKYLAVFIPVMLVVLVCLVSPVNGYLRYSLPYTAAAPIVISLMLASYTNRHRKSRKAKESPRVEA